MKKKIIFQNEVDISKQFIIVWKSKILILSISICFLLLSFLLNFFENKKFQKKIFVNISLDRNELYNINNFEKKIVLTPDDITKRFNFNFLSRENILQFMEKNKKFDDFKYFLKRKNISLDEYFSLKNFGISNEKTDIKFFFNYSNEIDADLFISEYTTFIKDKINLEHKNEIINFLNKEMNLIERNIIIAENISQEKPIFREGDRNLYNNNQDLYNKGSIVLKFELNEYKRILKNLENNKNFAYFKIELSTLTNVLPNYSIKSYEAFFLGFFLAIIFVILRNNIQY